METVKLCQSIFGATEYIWKIFIRSIIAECISFGTLLFMFHVLHIETGIITTMLTYICIVAMIVIIFSFYFFILIFFYGLIFHIFGNFVPSEEIDAIAIILAAICSLYWLYPVLLTM